jgi:hypothetical protein
MSSVHFSSWGSLDQFRPPPYLRGVKKTPKRTNQRHRGGYARAAALRERNAKRDSIIRSRRCAGESVAALAAEYGLTRQGIYYILAQKDAAA